MSTGEFSGKVALVTGGASGIGRATALAFAKAGAAVAVDDIDEAGGRETVAMIEAAGGRAIFILADVTDEAAVERMVAETVAAFGRLDCAFNNAGISGGSLPSHYWDSDIFAKTVAVNQFGVFYCMKHEIAQILKQGGGGAIVNTSSIAGMSGSGHPGYVASKHAAAGLARGAALSYAAQNIRVNAVCPGAIRTPMVARVVESSETNRKLIEGMHPMNRIGEANEVADAVLFLCSERASFITGHPLAVDGGYLAR